MAVAFSNSSRAASPCSGSSRIWGYLPFSSQARKNIVQSMSGTSSSRGMSRSTLRPLKEGCGTSTVDQSLVWRFSTARSWERSGRSWRAFQLARILACFSRFSASAVSRRSVSSRSETTPTLREASWTWSTGWLKHGAIFTAVCCALVVAPPMSSGISKPSRSISSATWTISSRLGVMRPERPIMSASTSRAFSRILLAGTMTPMSTTS